MSTKTSIQVETQKILKSAMFSLSEAYEDKFRILGLEIQSILHKIIEISPDNYQLQELEFSTTVYDDEANDSHSFIYGFGETYINYKTTFEQIKEDGVNKFIKALGLTKEEAKKFKPLFAKLQKIEKKLQNVKLLSIHSQFQVKRNFMLISMPVTIAGTEYIA